MDLSKLKPSDLRPADLMAYFEHYLTYDTEFPEERPKIAEQAERAFGEEIRRRLDLLEHIEMVLIKTTPPHPA